MGGVVIAAWLSLKSNNNKNVLQCINAGTAVTNVAMIIEKELRKLLHRLIKDEIAQITLGGSDVCVHVYDNATKISLSSPVYFGGNFIPLSVRNCLTKKPLFERGHITTYLHLDETSRQISLNFVGSLEHLNKRMFIDLLEEFSWLADEWRLYLDEHDKNDLIHVRVK